ncbi:MAG: tetratricopeptide repeat protein [Anaerolineaceae bacterium]|nr:tetratricopeptide repeat protein [Anaerolineaceae bacterium]
MNSQLASNALPFLIQANKNQPDDIQIITNLASAFLQLGNIKDAQMILENSPYDYTADSKLALVTGKVLYANNDFTKSQPVLRFAYKSENSEDSLVAYTNLLLRLSENNSSEINHDYLLSELTEASEKILTRHIDSKEPFKLLQLLADVNLVLGLTQEAYDQYVALLNQPESRSAQSYQHIQFGIGLSASRLNLNEISLAALQEAVMSKPDEPKYRQALALAFVQSNLPGEGIECAKAALQISNENVENLLWYSDFVIANGQPKLAISALREALQKNPAPRSLFLKLAQTYVLVGNHSEAKDVIEKMIKVDDITDQEMHKAADIYLQLNEYEDATRLLKNAILLHSEPDFNILHDLAYSLALLGDFDGSVELINTYTSDFNNDDRFSILKSDILAFNMQYEEASNCLDPILNRLDHQFDSSKIINQIAIPNKIEIDYSKSGVFHRKAQLDRIRGDLYNAQAFNEKAIEEDPTPFQNQLLAMELYFSLGNNLQAIDCFEKLATIDLIDIPSTLMDEAAFLRCEIALDTGDHKGASELFSQYFSQRPVSSSSLAIQARISNHKKENNLAENFFKDALNRNKEETQSQKSSLKSIHNHFKSIWSNFALAKTAQELQMWDTAYELFSQIIAKIQVIPIINFAFAEFLLYAFQNQQISKALRIATHAASFDAESDDFRSLLDLQTSNASRFIDEERISSFKVKANAILEGYWSENEPLKDHIKTSLDAVAILPILSSDEQISEILDAFPNDFNVAFQNALLSSEQDKEKCNRKIKELFILDTTYPPLYALQALCNKDDMYVSTQSMETALSFWPDEPDWHCFLAEQYMNNSQFGLAAHHLEKAVDLLPDQAYYWQLLGEVKLQEKDIAAAKSYFSKACDIFPDNPEALFSLGQMNRKLGDLTTALECFEKSLELKPNCIETRIALINVLLEKGEIEKGLENISALLSANPQNVDVQVLYISALIANNEIEEAESKLEAFLKLNPESTPLKLKQIELVTIYSGNDAALPLLLELSEMNPDDAHVQLVFASALIKSNDLDKAENVMQQSLSVNPDQATMHLSLGRIKRKKGQLDQAISVLSKAITLDPSLIDAYIELGITHQNRREQSQAIEVFHRAAQIAPNDHRPLYHAGLAFRESKDYKNAEIMLRNAAQLAPNDTSIRRQLAGVIALNLVHNLQEPRNYEHYK